MRVIQWNIRNLNSNFQYFKYFIVNNKVDIIAIQETMINKLYNPNINYNVAGYNFYNNVDMNMHRGTGIYIKNNILSRQIKIKTDLDCTAIEIDIGRETLTLLSIYLQCNVKIKLGKLQGILNQIKEPYLVVGDLNAYNTIWGSRYTNKRGETISKLIEDNRLSVFNNSSYTFFSVPHKTYTAIDVTLGSQCLDNKIHWQVGNSTEFSDHYPIYIDIHINTRYVNLHNDKWIIKKANWEKYINLLDARINNQTSYDLSKVQESMLEVAKICIPSTKNNRTFRKNIVPYWTVECSKYRAIKVRAERKYKKHRTEENFLIMRKTSAKLRQVIRREKRRLFKEKVEKFNQHTHIGTLWKTAKAFKTGIRTFKFPQLRVNNNIIYEPQEVVEVFVDYFSSISSDTQYDSNLIVKLDTIYTDNRDNSMEVYNLPITEQELDIAISSSGETSVGPDKIAYSFFRHMSKNTKQYVLKCINKAYVTNKYPESWKIATIVPILKPGKKPEQPESYRPISLTSCVGKIMERIIKVRLDTYLENNNLLDSRQFGFKKNHSTAEPLTILCNDIKNNLKKHMYTQCIFLDLDNAYNRIHSNAIINQLYRWKIKGFMLNYLTNFLKNRKIQVRCGNIVSTLRDTHQGIPQGSVLSPLLYKIGINDISMCFDNTSTSYVLYADDIAIWNRNIDMYASTRMINISMILLHRYLMERGLKISLNKTKRIIFKNKKNFVRSVDIKIENTLIEQVKTHKYLGIILDQNLNFTEHIKQRQNMVNRRINFLRYISGQNWGANRKILTTVYKTTIRSVIEYQAHLMNNITPQQNKQLEKLQNRCLRIITGAVKSTPAASLQADTNIPSIQHRIVFLYIKQAIRSQALDCKVINDIYEPRVVTSSTLPNVVGYNEYYKYNELLQRNREMIHKIPKPIYFWKYKQIAVDYLIDESKSGLLDYEIKVIFNEYLEKHDGSKFIYTDGSKQDSRCGMAFYTQLGEHHVYSNSRLADNTSIYNAELIAIETAVTFVIKSKINNVIICTDSKSATQAINRYVKVNNTHINYIHSLYSESNQDIKILWIPGHVGIEGNEVADTLAKQTLKQTPNSNYVYYTREDQISLLKNQFKEYLTQQWRKNTENSLLNIKHNFEFWSTSNCKSRYLEVSLSRLRTAHTYGRYLEIINKESNICRYCNVHNSIDHLLIVCKKYEEQRRDIIKYFLAENRTLNLENLLGNNQNIVNLVLQYIQRCNMRI